MENRGEGDRRVIRGEKVKGTKQKRGKEMELFFPFAKSKLIVIIFIKQVKSGKGQVDVMGFYFSLFKKRQKYIYLAIPFGTRKGNGPGVDVNMKLLL